jgi:EmrB/QacA subfamily drug resistance transporter
VATFLSGLDNAVVATASPTMVAQLGGLDLYAWVFTAYLLSSTASVPLYGKLADLYGRKRLFLVATSLFIIGSALCGQAPTMLALVAFRFVQGLGAGGLYPVTLVIIGDAFPLEQRARLTGLFSVIWGAADLLGPAVGGFLTEQVSWRWVFYVNLPLCLLAMLLVAAFLHERIDKRTVSVDYPGAALLAGTVGAFLLGLQGGRLPLLALAGVLGLGLILWERRASEPLLPLHLFGLRVIWVGTASRLLVGVVLFGQPAFVPPLLQGVMGIAPTLAGFILSGTAVGWAAASNVSGRAILRWGYRTTGVVGAALLALGFLLLRLLGAGQAGNLIASVLVQFVIGLGFGAITPVSLLSMQNAVDWGQRGVVTGVSQLALNIGGTLGVSLAGALFAFGLSSAVGSGVDPTDVLSADRRALLGPAQIEAARGLLLGALAPVYSLFVVAATAGLAVMTLLPAGRPESGDVTS